MIKKGSVPLLVGLLVAQGSLGGATGGFQWREREIQQGRATDLYLLKPRQHKQSFFNITSKLLKYMILFDIRWLGFIQIIGKWTQQHEQLGMCGTASMLYTVEVLVKFFDQIHLLSLPSRLLATDCCCSVQSYHATQHFKFLFLTCYLYVKHFWSGIHQYV